MKHQLIILLAFFSILSSCSDENKDSATEVIITNDSIVQGGEVIETIDESGVVEEVEEASALICRLTARSIKNDMVRGHSALAYSPGQKTLTVSEDWTHNNKNDKYTLTIYEGDDNLIDSIVSKDKGKTMKYFYGPKGLNKIIFNESQVTVFEYNEKGQIVKQSNNINMNGRLMEMGLKAFEYDKAGAPIKMTESKRGNVVSVYQLSYDDKVNPIISFGLFMNPNIFQYGYPVACYKNNITSTKSENIKETYQYTYNEQGYPTTVKMTMGDKQSIATYEYACE